MTAAFPVRSAPVFDPDALLDEAARLSRAGKPGEAIAILSRLVAEHGDRHPAITGRCQIQISDCYAILGDGRAALHHAQLAVDACRIADERQSLVRALGGRSHALYHLGRYREAAQSGYETLAMAEQLGDDDTLLRTLSILGGTEKALGEFARAKGHHQRAVEIGRRRPEFGPLLVVALTNYAIALSAEAQRHLPARPPECVALFEQALAHSLEALELCRRIGDTRNETAALRLVSVSYLACEHFERADHYTLQGIAHAEKTGALGEKSYILTIRAYLHMSTRQWDAARQAFLDARSLGEQLHDLSTLLNCEQGLGELAERIGDKKAALQHFKSFEALQQQVSKESARAELQGRAAKHDAEKTRLQAESHRVRADNLSAENQTLERRATRLAREVSLDALTGLANRRHLDTTLRKVFRPAPARRRPLVAMLIDLDHFKQINDRYSHQTGDAVLRQTGALLRDLCPAPHLPARYGGEEFAVLIAGDMRLAYELAERVRVAMESFCWSTLQDGLRVTVSAGLASLADCEDAATLFSLADARLYEAKRQGRNRVVSR